MTIQEYILHEKTLLDQFALDNRLREAQASIDDWHQLFYNWTVIHDSQDIEHYPHIHD